jgi:hypothetical protein
MRAKYNGATSEQIAFGCCHDPRKILEIGKWYDVEDIEEHNWYTKIRLVGIYGKFNSVSFTFDYDE